MKKDEILEDTVEYLDAELKKVLGEIENIAAKVHKGELGAYEGFMETEKYNAKVVELGNKLKAKGIDVTQLEEYQNF